MKTSAQWSLVMPIVLLLVSAPMLACADRQAAIEMNGRYWMSWKVEQKLSFLQGFYTALDAMSIVELGKADAEQVNKNYRMPQMTAGEIIASLDGLFVQYPELRRARIVACLALTSLNARGMTEEFQARKDGILKLLETKE